MSDVKRYIAEKIWASMEFWATDQRPYLELKSEDEFVRAEDVAKLEAENKALKDMQQTYGKEPIEIIDTLWDKFGDVEFDYLTSYETREFEQFMNDVEALLNPSNTGE